MQRQLQVVCRDVHGAAAGARGHGRAQEQLGREQRPHPEDRQEPDRQGERADAGDAEAEQCAADGGGAEQVYARLPHL